MMFDRFETHLIDSDDVALAIALSGQAFRFTLRDREAVLHTGDAVPDGCGGGWPRRHA